MDEALIKRLYDLIDPYHAFNLRKFILAHVGRPATFIQTFTTAIQKWVSSTATSCMLNHNIMVDAWYPNNDTMKLWRHLKTCAIYW